MQQIQTALDHSYISPRMKEHQCTLISRSIPSFHLSSHTWVEPAIGEIILWRREVLAAQRETKRCRCCQDIPWQIPEADR